MMTPDYIVRSLGFGLFALERNCDKDELGQLKALAQFAIDPVAMIESALNPNVVFVAAAEGKFPCSLEMEAYRQFETELTQSIAALQLAQKTIFENRLAMFRFDSAP